MESIDITYRVTRAKKTEQFDFRLHPETFELLSGQPTDPPDWARLEHQQCSHCPLRSEEHPYCPIALQLNDIVERFQGSSSIDEVEMEVVTEERQVIQRTALQRAIASMLELIFPASGCPKTEHMRPLARFHLPLASEEENVFRVTGMYLLGQYFLSTAARGGRIEFQGLIDLYADLSILHKAVASRLQLATRSDSVKNAITLLDMYSTLVPLLLEDELAEMRGFFKAFLPEEAEQQVPVATTNYLQSIKDATLELEPLAEDADAVPEWLKEARGEQAARPAEEPEKNKKKEEAAGAVDAILKNSKLNLELVPVEGEKSDKDSPKSGKASFKLPDD